MNLREEIVQYIHRAIESSTGYEGDEKAQTQHAWEQITADRIIHAVIRELPMPIDRAAKYEEFDGDGINVTVDSEDPNSVAYLCQFADDTGFNRYHKEMMGFFQNLYKSPQTSVQSEYERKPIHRNKPEEGGSYQEQKQR